MNRIVYVLSLCLIILSSCRSDTWMEPVSPDSARQGIAFKLRYEEFEEASTRSASLLDTDYDRVEFCIVDESGDAVNGIKGLYDPSRSEIRIEGLREGNYRLLILGVVGDETADGVTINPIRHIDETWLLFPADLYKPLEAEYFYSQTPFSVIRNSGPSGDELTALLDEEVVQRRIIGRTDFSFTFNNPYVESALSTRNVTLHVPRFRTDFSGSGSYSGETDGTDVSMDLLSTCSYLFPPTTEGNPLDGEIELTTRNYRGETVRRTYDFTLREIAPNRIGKIHTTLIHPDDPSGTAFITEQALKTADLSYILQDDEPHSIYTNSSLRSFNTSAPLQVSITEEGQLHVRFYSPRDLSDVLIQALIPSVSSEYIDLAYFDRIPAFADFYGELRSVQHKTFFRSESGRIVETGPIPLPDLATATFRITSNDPFWSKLEAIEHGWNISFSLYGGNPELPDGGPVGNWMGIRPVHCREAVALFLNFTYMIDMPEHEEILRANVDRLYGNGGPTDKVSVETVLQQMRQRRTLQVGLVYPGNGVIGLGGGNVFGAYQQAWFQHYFNTYSCEILFHELGHVMGYNHSSSFTYGPWAQELMNRFYVEHITEMPIDSPSYLKSEQNPNKY